MGVFASAILLVGADISASAPTTQITCIYDTVPQSKLTEFGKSAIGEEAEAGIASVLNVARNACIDIHGWTEAQAELAEIYFGNRVARERVMQLVNNAGVDVSKLDRAFAHAIRRNSDGGQHYKAALELEGYPVYDDMRKLADGYAQLRYTEQKAREDFDKSPVSLNE
jgi:hypothetical protein